MSDEDEDKGTAACLGVLAIPVVIALNGWTLSWLWAWFAVPYLHAPVITTGPAVGLAMIVRMLTHQRAPKVEERLASTVLSAFLWPLVTLLFGWVTHLIVGLPST